MTSTVYFRMFHGKEPEPVTFAGPSIRLLDLKRQILEKKNMKTVRVLNFAVSTAHAPRDSTSTWR